MTPPNPASTSRRRFLGVLAAPAIIPASAYGRGATPPNSRINIGIIGSGSRALFEGKYYVPIDGCQVTAVCDVQETRRQTAKDTFEKLYAERTPSGTFSGVKMYSDFRELLAQKDIDAVYIVSPDHWHVPMLIAALKAGKAVHQEKPLGVSIAHDLAALKAAKKYPRPFFYGPERRSTPDARKAVELVLNGRIGKVKEIIVASPRSVASPMVESTPVPKGFDYDMWLGPAPLAPFSQKRVSEGMFHIYDYCLGFISNWGIHLLDQVQWWADNAGMGIPVKYEGTAKFPTEGMFNCATDWDLRLTYENGLLLRYMDANTYNTRTDLPPIPGRKGNNAAVFVGTEGTVAISYERVATEPASLMQSEIGPNEKRLFASPSAMDKITGKGIWDYPAAAHQLAWIESLKSGKPGVHSIETAVNADLIAQLSDLCTRHGRPVQWDPKKQTIVGDSEMQKHMSRPMRSPWSLAV